MVAVLGLVSIGAAVVPLTVIGFHLVERTADSQAEELVAPSFLTDGRLEP